MKKIMNGTLDTKGHRADNRPESYRGIWVGVVRAGEDQDPLIMFDGNGRVLWLADDVNLTEHDWQGGRLDPAMETAKVLGDLGD